MQIIKPLRLSLLHRPYRWLQHNYLGVSIMALTDMSATPRLRPEPELWQLTEAELKTCNGIIDLAMPKSSAEFLATGYAYTHHQTDKTACCARIQVEQLDKTLMVSGDRHWVGDKPSEPQKFGQMRLDWSRAFGGKNYEENPHGIGFAPETEENGGEIHRLPNIEAQNRQLLSPRDTPNPASFCPLGLMWPRRFTRIGKKYDEQWLENEFPGFSRDIDWRLFNSAPRDQWWEQYQALPENAAWRIWNMHPEKPLQAGKLPPWQARCFIKRLRADEEVFEEIIMRNTTVWFFPHLEQMLLIWHGSARINEDDATDVVQMLSAMELSHEACSENYYLQILNQRTDKAKGALYAFREKDLIPESIIGPWVDTEQPKNASPLRTNLQNREKRLREQQKERMAKYGKDISALIPPCIEQPSNPRPDELPEFVHQIEQDAAQKYLEAEQLWEKMRAIAQERGIEVDPIAMKDPLRGPQNSQQIRNTLYQQHDQQKHDQQTSRELSDTKLEQLEQSLHKMYLASVQAQPPALRLTGNLSQIIRKRVQRIMQEGGDFRAMDFTGADLSGMDLRGANFSHSLLESACFNNSQLDGADFSEAMLARTEICHASLYGVKLDSACLAQAKCEQSDFSAASFKETQLQETLFDHCRFNHAVFTDLLLQTTFIKRCRFQHSQWQGCTFLEMVLPSLKFNHASLKKVSFIKCQLENAVFDHAMLESCSWVATKAEAIRFRSAKLLNCVFTLQSVLNQADFCYATLTECNLRQTPLVQASFCAATLNNSDLSEANCQLADMQYLHTSKSLFVRTDFRNALLNNANLIGAFMQKCTFCGTNLREANLFRTDMSQSIIDNTTLINHTYTQRTKTLPKRDQEVI
ncbi:DUF2169 family type VI secretion system accessory protein [Xenorhabdus doucetiae]|uniref:Putative exported protein (Pentapeptide repaet protein) n=1 Tax=Xenorhabdus doucetiae TaxID=351671 RepID=A0A068QUQ9_9GAMM|nr:DUF2169 domain-containing protein [Xenorhabdus doucetiae]TYP12356.1 uncharacterized protein YjbI with pentapeptide repeats [Xenorhabdus doucetiae]CDG17600.1 putative exported protein (pentapeptide repaet protein) [Xenorhabdus doucetiae]